MPGKLKRKIIKRMMKLFERAPRLDDYSLNEIFNHSSFTGAGDVVRREIMFKSSERAYLDESVNHSFESHFKNGHAGFLTGKTALDLGCFTGGRAVAWVERWQLKKISGIDIRDVLTEAAGYFAKQKGVNAEFVTGTGEKIPFDDNSFDAIFSFDVFEHVQDLNQTLRECYRVLRTGGRLYLVFPSFYGLTDHHLGHVTLTPLVHVFFNKNDVNSVYNEIMDERGEAAGWYRRRQQELEPWEKCNTINGTTARGFARMIRNQRWKVLEKNTIPILGGTSKKYAFLRPLRPLIRLLAGLPWFEEFLSTRIIYVLEKV